MIGIFSKMFTEQLKLSPDLWLIALAAIVVVAFAVPVALGLVSGSFKTISSRMKAGGANGAKAYEQMKLMPAEIKQPYKTARMVNAVPSTLVTRELCVDKPYRQSLLSKAWIVTFIATAVCAALAFVLIEISPVSPIKEDAAPEEIAAAAKAARIAPYVGTAVVLMLGGILTLVAGVIAHSAFGGAVKAYAKFAVALDGGAQSQGYADARSDDEQSGYTEAQPVYGDYDNRSVGAEPVVQTVEEDVRRRPFDGGRVQNESPRPAAQAARTAEPPKTVVSPKPQSAQPQAGASSVSIDSIVAQIDKLSAEGATREKMREIAALIQKERSKPENKTPELQNKLNAALTKLLKAMSAKPV